MAALGQLAGLENLYPIALYHPFVLQLVQLAVLYWLLQPEARELGFPNGWYLGAVFYLLGNFVNQDYLSPQSAGYFLLTVFFGLLLGRERWLKDYRTAWGYKVLLGLVFIGLTFTHFLSSLVALVVLGVLALRERKAFLTLLLFCSVVIVAWNPGWAFNFSCSGSSRPLCCPLW